jgi:hypothetical protein
VPVKQSEGGVSEGCEPAVLIFVDDLLPLPGLPFICRGVQSDTQDPADDFRAQRPTIFWSSAG